MGAAKTKTAAAAATPSANLANAGAVKTTGAVATALTAKPAVVSTSAGKAAGLVTGVGAAITHLPAILAIILLLPFSLLLAIIFFWGKVDDPRQSAPRRRAERSARLRTIRTLAIPVTLTALSAFVLITAIVQIYSAIAPRPIGIAAGQINSEAYFLTQALQKVSSRPPVKLGLILLAPGSDAENMQRLSSGQAALAIAGSDIAPVPIARSVAVLYDNAGHLLVHQDSTIARFPDLKGKRIGLPQTGDDYRAFLALAKYYNLSENDFIFAGGDQDSADATFAGNESEAIFRLQSAGSPYIKKIVATTGAKLLPLDDGAALKLLSPGYEAISIPKGTYGGDPPVPAADTPTLATRRVLYARKDLAIARVFDLSGILFQRRAELAAALPNEAKDLRQLATAARKPPTTSFDAAIHPGVEELSRSRQDPFVVRYGITLILFVAGLVIAVAAVLEWRRAGRRRQKYALDRYNSRLVGLMDDSPKEQATRQENLKALQLQAIEDLERDRLSPEGFAAFQSVWTAAMQKAQRA